MGHGKDTFRGRRNQMALETVYLEVFPNMGTS